MAEASCVFVCRVLRWGLEWKLNIQSMVTNKASVACVCVCVVPSGGALSGKYLQANPDPKARFNLFKGYMERYNKSLARDATEEYVKVAQKYDLTPTQLALAWCRWVLDCCAVL